MRKLWALLISWALLAPTLVLAGGGEGLDVPEGLDKKVPLEGLGTVARFIARTYNDNLVLYALYCTAAMAVIGVTIAFVTDILLAAMGMEVHKIEHKE